MNRDVQKQILKASAAVLGSFLGILAFIAIVIMVFSTIVGSS